MPRMRQPSSRTVPEYEHEQEHDDASRQQRFRGRPPLPFAKVDEMVKEFYAKHPAMWQYDKHPSLREFYSPTTMPAFAFQNAADAPTLQRQAEVHLNVAALLSAFAFAAAAAEGALETSGSTKTIDQAIFITLCLATVLLLGTVLHFMYIDMGLGTKGGSRYWQAYSAKLGTSCVSFHIGCVILAACFPLWGYRKFGLEPAFFATAAFAVLWMVYDLCMLLPTHNHMNQLLAHAEMGIDAREDLKHLGHPLKAHKALCWAPEAWELLYRQRMAEFEAGVQAGSPRPRARGAPGAAVAAVM